MFDGLYTIVSKNENEIVIKLTDDTHPIFKAHFPGNPILPGFVHFEIISDIFNIKVESIKKAKYSAIIKPQEELKYIRNNNKYKVINKDGIEVVIFSL
jgi:3-hydroxyacyl-[acyl-carrier-protein] dehydratase